MEPNTNLNISTPSPHRFSTTKLIGLLLVAAALFIIIFVYSNNNDTPKEVSTNITVTQVPHDKNPDKFPSDIPIEAHAKIFQNYNAFAHDGRFQATRSFETTQRPAQNYTIYTDFFSTNEWFITNSFEQDGLRFISAKKGSTYADVTISEGRVDISITEFSQ